MYYGRWIRGALMIVVPILTVGLVGAFIAIADPATSFVLRNAAAVTFLVASTFFMYHLFVVADAFAGRRRNIASLRGGHVLDYVVLGVVCGIRQSLRAARERHNERDVGDRTGITAARLDRH